MKYKISRLVLRTDIGVHDDSIKAPMSGCDLLPDALSEGYRRKAASGLRAKALCNGGYWGEMCKQSIDSSLISTPALTHLH